MMVKELKTNNMPNTKGKSPVGYTPYKMSGGGVGNSPIIKNFGNQQERGFETTPAVLKNFGTSDTEFLDQETTNPGTALNYNTAVGSSPAKNWWKKAIKGVKQVGKKAIGAVTGKVNDLAGIDNAEIAPHGDEAHTGGGGGDGAAASVTDVSGKPMDPMNPGNIEKDINKRGVAGLGGVGGNTDGGNVMPFL